MQNRLFIKTFAIALGLACLYHMSFTYKVKQIEKEAQEYSNGDYKIDQDSLQAWGNKEVYNLGFVKLHDVETESSIWIDTNKKSLQKLCHAKILNKKNNI